MIGSVFSPYYAAARHRGTPDAEHYSAINVVLYSPQGKRWALTERGKNAVRRNAAELSIGPSRVAWQDGRLVILVDEITVPWPRRLRGTIRLEPGALNDIAYPLDAGARHHWRPIAPRSGIEVEGPDQMLRHYSAGSADRRR